MSLLQLHTNPDVVTKLDFNFCYWIPRNEIVHFVKQCKNLKELAVAHSTIGSKDLEEILSENVKISKLSISIHYPETFEQNEKLVDKPLLNLNRWNFIWDNIQSFLQLSSGIN